MTKIFLKNSNGNFIVSPTTGEFIYRSVPDTFTELEYLEAGSGQYIETNLNYNHTNTLEVYGKSYTSSTGTRGCVSSEYAQGSGLGFEIISGLRTYNNGSPDFTNSGYKNNEENSYSVLFDRTAQTIVSSCKGTVVSKSGLYGNNGFNFYLFVDRAKRFSTFNKTHRLYYYSMIKDGALYCYLVPVRRNSDNELGMYDIVNNVFYTNAGTGTFDAGESV